MELLTTTVGPRCLDLLDITEASQLPMRNLHAQLPVQSPGVRASCEEPRHPGSVCGTQASGLPFPTSQLFACQLPPFTLHAENPGIWLTSVLLSPTLYLGWY